MIIGINKDTPVQLSVLIIIIIIFWLLTAILMIMFLTSWEQRSQFGDMFGAVNALFSGLAFAVLIYTIWLQRIELSLQRQELELTRQELARTATAQEATQKAIELQVELMTLSTDVSATATLLEANQHAKKTMADHYGYQLEKMQREIHARIKDFKILKSEPSNKNQ